MIIKLHNACNQTNLKATFELLAVEQLCLQALFRGIFMASLLRPAELAIPPHQ